MSCNEKEGNFAARFVCSFIVCVRAVVCIRAVTFVVVRSFVRLLLFVRSALLRSLLGVVRSLLVVR